MFVAKRVIEHVEKIEKNMKKIYTLLPVIAVLFCTIINSTIKAQPPLVFDVENTGASCTVTAGNLQNNPNLPDPFNFTNGGRVATFEDWKCRRNEIKADIERYEIGTKPNKPSNITATYSGTTLTVKVTENGQTLTLTSNFSVPSGAGPHPIVIGMNSGTGGLSSSLFSGVVQVPFNHDQVVSYALGSGTRNANDPYYKLYPNLNNSGKYSGWSWGISRLIDGLELVADQLNLDIKRIAVTGCSYAGKMALFGGAFDERIALTIVQESGGGGVNAWRLSQDFTTRTGTNIEKINNTNGSWFMQSMMSLDPYRLPHDHHELIAMIAPRPVLILGNSNQVWLGDESGYKSTMAALEVWKAMGVGERVGFDFSTNHPHCSASTSQNNAVTGFVNKYLRNNASANTNFRVAPSQGGFDLNYQSAIDWTTPTITFNPNIPKVVIASPENGVSIELGETVSIAATVTDADNNVTKVEFFSGDQKIGEDATAPYSFAWTPTTAGTYSLTATATDASANTGSASVSLTIIGPPYEIFKTPTPPVMDGTADPIWENSSVLAVEAQNVIVESVTNAADLSGNAKFLWDNDYLYVFATVTDDSQINDSQNSYEDDAVEIYIDINNDKAATYGANDVQYTFGWDDGAVVGSLPSGRLTTGITYAVLDTDDGYIIEARIPWTTTQGSPAVNQLIGIDFMINDDDNGTGRDGKLSWSATADDAWQNPSLFGVAKLVSEPLVTGNSSFITSSLSYYPNPFTNGLMIEAPENTAYQLISIDGRIMEEGRIKKNTDIGKGLVKGSYLLRLQYGDEAVTKIVLKN